jgi:hypothetical protein
MSFWQKQRAWQQNRSCGGEDRRKGQEGEYGGNIMYSCMKIGKCEPLNYSKNGGGGDKVEWWRDWIQLWCIARTFVSVTIYPQYNNNMIIKINNNKSCKFPSS